MNKHMFISTHNYWFSRLTLLASLVVLSGILLGMYTQLLAADNPAKKWTELLQPYFTSSTIAITFFLTGAAWYLHRELNYKPFVICLGLLILAISQYFIEQWSNLLHLASNTALAQTLVSLFILSLFWWVSSITGPRDYILVNENDKKYRLWSWLGFLLLFSQMLLSSWVTTNHADHICVDFPYCNGQLLPKLDFYTLWVSPLNQDGLVTLHMLHRISTIVTTIYLTIFSLLVLFNRTLGEMGILIFLLMFAQIILGMIGLIWQELFWIIFAHDIISALLLLTMISLLIELYRKHIGSYS